MRPDLLLGIEGSGSTTQALVADLAGNVLGRGLGPSSNHHRTGFDKACAALTVAIDAAVTQASDTGTAAAGQPWASRVAAACLGLSGVDQASDQARFAQWLNEQGVISPTQVLNESELVLVGGTPQGWGVALISGSGSVCLGRTRDGRTARVGGWGPFLGDEGSGYQIAMQALQVATQAADGRGNARALLSAILAYWRLSHASELIAFVHRPGMEAGHFAELSVVVLEQAARGDGDALKIVN